MGKLISNKVYKARIKAEWAAAYGNKCECCGDQHLEFFVDDHIDGSGAIERRSRKSGNTGHPVRLRLRKLGWPKENHRILCHNCNEARSHFGYCPHELERAAVALLAS